MQKERPQQQRCTDVVDAPVNVLLEVSLDLVVRFALTKSLVESGVKLTQRRSAEVVE